MRDDGTHDDGLAERATVAPMVRAGMRPLSRNRNSASVGPRMRP